MEGDAIPRIAGMDGDPVNNCSTVEYPLELEHESPGKLEDGERRDKDGDDSEASEEEEEAEYTFQFEEEMDPLMFAEEEDASGLLPYERFERIENQYEVLASKKRAALQQCTGERHNKKLRKEENHEATFEELMETMNHGMRKKKSRKFKRRGRKKGSKSKSNPEVTRKLGNATLLYAHGRFEEAINVLKEVIRLAPNLSDPFHRLGLIYTALNDKKRSLNFYMIAAHLTPKDASLWKLLVSRSIELGDKGQANYCLKKAIVADPEDIDLRFHRAALYVELGEYIKAAESYEKIALLRPDDIEILRKATQLYQRCGQHERAVGMLENLLRNHVNDANLDVVDILASVLMDTKAYSRALEHIERLQHVLGSGKEIPHYLMIKAGICHILQGNLEKAEVYFRDSKLEDASSSDHLIIDVADSLMTIGHYESALKYYMLLKDDAHKCNGYLHLKIARCYVSLKKSPEAIEYYYKAIEHLDGAVDVRLMLSSLLLEENRDDEAISVLSPPTKSEPDSTESDTCKLWWRNGKIKFKLSQIYKAKGLTQQFADVLFPLIRETLYIEALRQKVRTRKRLSIGALTGRMKVLDDQPADRVFHGFRPLVSSAELSKASRAKRLLLKKAAAKEAKIAAGIDWDIDDSDDESPQVMREPPLPDLFKDEGDQSLIVEVCKSLSTLRRYWDALEIINLSLKLEANTLSALVKEELRTLGGQIAHNIADPAQGWDCVRHFVRNHPYSCTAWNCYYKGIMKNNRIMKQKFLNSMIAKHKDCVQPILIAGHHFTTISQHQTAAREYLEAHKLMPDNPLINLCAGTALINLALGHRLQNKHQAVLQGLAFLYNNSRICGETQESLYNIARAYHHVGLISLAATYYEKVLAMHEKDYPIPVLPNDNPDHLEAKHPGYCDLRREAAYNLHLIYKKSGAVDLARQILKDHVVL